MLRVLGRNLCAMATIAALVFVSMTMLGYCGCLKHIGFFRHFVLLAPSFVSVIIGSYLLSGNFRWDLPFVIIGVLAGHYSYFYYDYHMRIVVPGMIVVISYGTAFLVFVLHSAISAVGYVLGRGFWIDNKT